MSKLGRDVSDAKRIGADHGYGTGDGGDGYTAAPATRFDGRRRRALVERVQLNTRVPVGTKEMLDTLATVAGSSMQDTLVRVIREAFERLPPGTGQGPGAAAERD